MSRWIQDASWKRGQGVEAMFAKLLNERADNARAADLQEQFSHVDYISDFGKIDVKARKRTALRVLKNRFSGETGLACSLLYDKKTGRIAEETNPLFETQEGEANPFAA